MPFEDFFVLGSLHTFQIFYLGSCTRGNERIPASKRTPAIVKAPLSVVCPDGVSECPDGNTCCKLASGQYGCCPLPKAVCCSDQVHCCPTGYECQTGTGSCIRGNEKVLASKHTPAIVKAPRNVVCPDGVSYCPDGNTCCKLGSGQYGCCPLPKAVCCSDQVHCCPNGYTCASGILYIFENDQRLLCQHHLENTLF